MKGKMIAIVVVGLFLLQTNLVFAQDEDIQKYPSCKYCGMDRLQFAHSRVLIEYEDGTTQGTCSLHCTAIDLALNIDKAPKVIYVGDFGTKKLVNTEKAFWVIGGNRMGVMTQRAKWAFEQKKDAEMFMKDNGGAQASFEEAMKAVYEDMYLDTKMIRERRKMRKMKTMEHRHN